MAVVIVGAGVAGLVCARALAGAGLSPHILDKGRGPGGRMATRRTEIGQFDHGAPMIAPETEAGRAWLAAAVAEGRAARWPAAAEGGKVPHVGTPRMRDLCAGLTAGLNVRQQTEVREIRREGAQWGLRTDAEEIVAGHVVVTAPAPQAARLLSGAAPEVTARLAQVSFAPCYTLMAGFAHPPATGAVLRPGGAFDLVLRESSKPGRDTGTECWVAHATAEWSRANLEIDRDDAADALLAALEQELGPLPPVRFATAHRWRFARTADPLGTAFAASADGTLLAGGDWALGPDMEDAVASGEAMARALLQSLDA